MSRRSTKQRRARKRGRWATGGYVVPRETYLVGSEPIVEWWPAEMVAMFSSGGR